MRSIVKPPRRWVIVSDGSTDKTDEIVKEWARRYPFIEFVRVEKSGAYGFATKVRALRTGFERLSDIDHEFIGVLDADLSFEADYFERVLERFANEPRLGIAGGRHTLRSTARATARVGRFFFRAALPTAPGARTAASIWTCYAITCQRPAEERFGPSPKIKVRKTEDTTGCRMASACEDDR